MARRFCLAVVVLGLTASVCGPARAQPATTTAPATKASTQPAGPAVLAYGTTERLWLAELRQQGEAVETFIISRTGSDARWQRAARLAGRAVTLTARRSELVVLLDGGQWMLVSDFGERGGPPLPNGGSIVCLAGGERGLWAVGMPRPATTRPTTMARRGATGPSAVTTRAASVEVEAAPATAPATRPAEPALFELTGTGWAPRGPLPQRLEAPILLAASDLYVADVAERSVRFWSRGRDDAWHDAGVVDLPAAPLAVRLVRLDDKPLLYAAMGDGDGLIWRRQADGAWVGPVRVPAHEGAFPGQGCDVAAALGDLRRVCLAPFGEPIEQVIGLHGDIVGAPVRVPGPPARVDPRIMRAVHVAALLLVGWIMVLTLRRRELIRQAIARVDRSVLAPLWARFAAGMVDALPLLAALVVLDPEPSEHQLGGWLIVLGVAGGIYVAHTTLTEVLWGRSIGKMLFRLRVAGLDGGRPAATAMLVRNVLRPLDVLTVMPLVMIVLSPLRQRMGDLAAGTMVVRSSSRASGG